MRRDQHEVSQTDQSEHTQELSDEYVEEQGIHFTLYTESKVGILKPVVGGATKIKHSSPDQETESPQDSVLFLSEDQ